MKPFHFKIIFIGAKESKRPMEPMELMEPMKRRIIAGVNKWRDLANEWSRWGDPFADNE